jgi:putative membrane protein
MPMYGWNDGWSWWAMALSMVVFWGLVVAGIVIVVRILGKPAASRDGLDVRDGSEARRILEKRFARGEIDQEEYRSRLRTLSG